MSDSLGPHGLQHTRLPCPPSTPRACSNSCPPSQWCPPTISSSVVSFSSCFQSFPASGSFPQSQFFASVGQSIGASASVLPMKFQGWFPLKVKVLVTQSYTTLCEPTNCNLPDSLSIEFSRQEYWIGLPFPSPGVISFRIHWFGISGVQGTIKSLLQHHSSKASIFWH